MPTDSRDRLVPTAMQMRVLRALAEGGTTESAAEQLHLSVHTVRRHLEGLRQRTGLRHLHQILLWAIRSGWLPELLPEAVSVPVPASADRPLPPPELGLTVCLWGDPDARELEAALEPLRGEPGVGRCVVLPAAAPRLPGLEEAAGRFGAEVVRLQAGSDPSAERACAAVVRSEWLLLLHAGERVNRELIWALQESCRRAGDRLDLVRLPVQYRLWERAAPLPVEAEPRLLRRSWLLTSATSPPAHRSSTLSSLDPRLIIHHSLAGGPIDALARLAAAAGAGGSGPASRLTAAAATHLALDGSGAAEFRAGLLGLLLALREWETAGLLDPARGAATDDAGLAERLHAALPRLHHGASRPAPASPAGWPIPARPPSPHSLTYATETPV